MTQPEPRRWVVVLIAWLIVAVVAAVAIPLIVALWRAVL